MWIIGRGFALVALVGLLGCGPLTAPMIRRLEPQEQQQIDLAWANMLTPVNRVDRQTLLDCLQLFQLYQLGTDRFDATSIKNTPQGRVEMTIHFDRNKPDDDRLRFRLLGSWNRVLREERWSGREVWDAINSLANRPSEPMDDAARAEAERRVERVFAATQPAMQPHQGND